MTGPRPAVAYVVNTLNPGGTERLVVDMSRAFARDYDMIVICLDEPGAWGRALRTEGIPVYCAWRQPGLDLCLAGRLARLFRANNVQLVHAHQCTPWFYAALARLRYRAPKLLLEEHGRFYPEVLNRKRVLFNRGLIAPLTEAFVAVSDDVRVRLGRYEGVDARKVRVIYNGVTPRAPIDAAARAQLRQKLGFAADDVVVGTVGRFDSIKNLPMLLRAISAASQAEPRIRGLLVGDGPEMPRVRALRDELQLATRVCLTGFREDARELTQCMDLFVLSSFSEGTSMALLEAMAAGVPVAVTAVGGNPEIVQAGESGWVVPSDDVGALSAALVEALADAELRARRAASGQRRFDQHFRFETMIGKYRELYRELLGQAA